MFLFSSNTTMALYVRVTYSKYLSRKHSHTQKKGVIMINSYYLNMHKELMCLFFGKINIIKVKKLLHFCKAKKIMTWAEQKAYN